MELMDIHTTIYIVYIYIYIHSWFGITNKRVRVKMGEYAIACFNFFEDT